MFVANGFRNSCFDYRPPHVSVSLRIAATIQININRNIKRLTVVLFSIVIKSWNAVRCKEAVHDFFNVPNSCFPYYSHVVAKSGGRRWNFIYADLLLSCTQLAHMHAVRFHTQLTLNILTIFYIRRQLLWCSECARLVGENNNVTRRLVRRYTTSHKRCVYGCT